MIIKLEKPFAANSKVAEYDVRQMKKALNSLGYYQPYEKTGITGIPDKEIFEPSRNSKKIIPCPLQAKCAQGMKQ